MLLDQVKNSDDEKTEIGTHHFDTLTPLFYVCQIDTSLQMVQNNALSSKLRLVVQLLLRRSDRFEIRTDDVYLTTDTSQARQAYLPERVKHSISANCWHVQSHATL